MATLNPTFRNIPKKVALSGWRTLLTVKELEVIRHVQRGCTDGIPLSVKVEDWYMTRLEMAFRRTLNMQWPHILRSYMHLIVPDVLIYTLAPRNWELRRQMERDGIGQGKLVCDTWSVQIVTKEILGYGYTPTTVEDHVVVKYNKGEIGALKNESNIIRRLSYGRSEV